MKSKYLVCNNGLRLDDNEEKQIVVVDPSAVSLDTIILISLIQLYIEPDSIGCEILLSNKFCDQKIADLFIGKTLNDQIFFKYLTDSPTKKFMTSKGNNLFDYCYHGTLSNFLMYVILENVIPNENFFDIKLYERILKLHYFFEIHYLHTNIVLEYFLNLINIFTKELSFFIDKYNIKTKNHINIFIKLVKACETNYILITDENYFFFITGYIKELNQKIDYAVALKNNIYHIKCLFTYRQDIDTSKLLKINSAVEKDIIFISEDGKYAKVKTIEAVNVLLSIK